MAKTNKTLAGIEEAKAANAATEETKATSEEMNDESSVEQESPEPSEEDSETSNTDGETEKPVKKDPLLELVEFMAPLEEKNNDDIIIIVNGKGWQIKRGRKVKIPKYVVDAYYLSQKQKLERLTFEDDLRKNSFLGDFESEAGGIE